MFTDSSDALQMWLHIMHHHPLSVRVKLKSVQHLNHSNIAETAHHIPFSELVFSLFQYTYTAPSQIVSLDAYSEGNTHTQV